MQRSFHSGYRLAGKQQNIKQTQLQNAFPAAPMSHMNKVFYSIMPRGWGGNECAGVICTLNIFIYIH